MIFVPPTRVSVACRPSLPSHGKQLHNPPHADCTPASNWGGSKDAIPHLSASPEGIQHNPSGARRVRVQVRLSCGGIVEGVSKLIRDGVSQEQYFQIRRHACAEIEVSSSPSNRVAIGESRGARPLVLRPDVDQRRGEVARSIISLPVLVAVVALVVGLYSVLALRVVSQTEGYSYPLGKRAPRRRGRCSPVPCRRCDVPSQISGSGGRRNARERIPVSDELFSRVRQRAQQRCDGDSTGSACAKAPATRHEGFLTVAKGRYRDLRCPALPRPSHASIGTARKPRLLPSFPFPLKSSAATTGRGRPDPPFFRGLGPSPTSGQSLVRAVLGNQANDPRDIYLAKRLRFCWLLSVVSQTLCSRLTNLKSFTPQRQESVKSQP